MNIPKVNSILIKLYGSIIDNLEVKKYRLIDCNIPNIPCYFFFLLLL